MRILNSLSVGSWRTDSAPASLARTSSVPSTPSRRVGLGGDREPDVELVVAQVVVRDAGVLVDHAGRTPRVLGVDLGRDQHRGVAESARVEDRGDLADDPLVDQALYAGDDLGFIDPGLCRHVLVGLLGDREAALHEVEQPLVEVVERVAAPWLRLRSFGPNPELTEAISPRPLACR